MRILDNGIYRDMTEAEIAELNSTNKFTSELMIEELKLKLSQTDYKAIKYAEGLLTDEEYAQTKALRQSWRDEINKLESEGVN